MLDVFSVRLSGRELISDPHGEEGAFARLEPPESDQADPDRTPPGSMGLCHLNAGPLKMAA